MDLQPAFDILVRVSRAHMCNADDREAITTAIKTVADRLNAANALDAEVAALKARIAELSGGEPPTTQEQLRLVPDAQPSPPS